MKRTGCNGPPAVRGNWARVTRSECGRPVKAKGLCSGHLEQQRVHGALTPLLGPGGRKVAAEHLVVISCRIPKARKRALSAAAKAAGLSLYDFLRDVLNGTRRAPEPATAAQKPP